MKLLLITVLCVITGGATLKSTDVALSLKGHPIPTDGSGVVIFKDIGGYLGPADGLICQANSSSINISQYWNYPNGTRISNLPSSGVFGTSSCGIRNGGSLYYSDGPKERGQFRCIFEIPSSVLLSNITLNIVDMNITGLNVSPDEIAIAGEDVELSINVTTFPEYVPVPYLWSVNGTNLLTKFNTSRYRGIQTDTLTISDVQEEDQGSYACSVANSASGINVNSTKLAVVDIKVQVSGSTNNPETAKSYTLNCAPSGVEPLINSQPEYEYSWLKDGQPFDDTQSTPSYTFKSLEFGDAGLYQCLVYVTFNRRLNRVTANGTSPPFPLTYQDAVYRIYLIIQSDCHQWTSTSNMPNKHADVTSHIIQGIKDQCNQIQVKDDIITNNEHSFKCPTYPKETVVYSAQIRGNELTNTSILVSCLDKWIQKTQVIVVNEVDLEINKECTNVVDDVNSSLDCGQKPPKKSSMPRDERIAIGVGVSALILLILAVVIICITCVKWYQQRAKYKQLKPQRG